LPHAFYPVQTDGYIEIGPGDQIAARCIMVNDQDHLITTGPKDSDEMCIFYIMYYIETDRDPLDTQVLDKLGVLGDDIEAVFSSYLLLQFQIGHDDDCEIVQLYLT